MLKIYYLVLKRTYTESTFVENRGFCEASGKAVRRSRDPYTSISVGMGEFISVTTEEGATHFIMVWEAPSTKKKMVVPSTRIHTAPPEVPLSKGAPLEGEMLADWVNQQVFDISLLTQLSELWSAIL